MNVYHKMLLWLYVLICVAAAIDVKAQTVIYQGQVPYPTTNPAGHSPGRTPSDRANDHGINILEYGANRNSVTDSSLAIQQAIDACYNTTGCRNVYCPDGYYYIYQSVFFDTPNSLRGGAPWINTVYYPGDIVAGTGGVLYRATVYHDGSSGNTIPPSAGWTNTPAINWSNTDTYNVNDTVIYNGIMWKSVGSGNTGNTPMNAFNFWKQTVQQGNIRPYWSASFTGSPGQAGGNGCRLFVQSGGYPAMWVFGNGMEVDSVTVQNNATGLYRCQNDPAQVGFAMAGGGSSLTSFRNVSVQNFYTGIETSTNGVDNVNDSNFIERSDVAGTCRGLSFPGTQNFQNTVIESRITDSRINVAASQNNGINVIGGNYTTGNTQSNTFHMSGVTFDPGIVNPGIYRLTATLSLDPAGTFPDPYLTNAACSGANDATFTASVTAGVMNVPSTPTFGTLAVNDYVYNPDHLGMFQITSFGTGSGGAGTYNLNDPTFTSSGSQPWRSTKRSDYPMGCTYDYFVVKTNGFGNIPFHLVNIGYGGYNYIGNNWNNNTAQITLQMDQPTSEQWANAWVSAAFKADVEAQSQIFASEMVTTFWTCGADISDIHIENANAATMFMNSVCTFGERKNTMRNIYVNYQADQTSLASVNPPAYLAQQTMPAIRSYTPLAIEGFDVGGIPGDRSILELAAGALFTIRDGILPFNIRLHALCDAHSFTGGTGCGRGSVGIGAGSFTGNVGGGNSSSTIMGMLSDVWRGGVANRTAGGVNLQGGLGTTDFVGRRPDPAQASCVTHAFLTNYTGPPSTITTTGVPSFTGAVTGAPSATATFTVSGYSGSGLFQGAEVYGKDMATLSLGPYVSGGTPGGNGVYSVFAYVNVSARPMSTLIFNVPYPILYGGQQYRVCDGFPWVKNPAFGNMFYSNHLGYSLGQPYTSTINPGLAWSLKRQSPALYMDSASLRFIHPGMVLNLHCNTFTKDVMVLESRATSGYLLILDANQDGAPYVPDFVQDCVGGTGSGGSGTADLTIYQAAYSPVPF